MAIGGLGGALLAGAAGLGDAIEKARRDRIQQQDAQARQMLLQAQLQNYGPQNFQQLEPLGDPFAPVGVTAQPPGGGAADLGPPMSNYTPGKGLGFSDIRNLALKAGYPPQGATMQAAIDMGESGGNPRAYNPNDPGGSYGLGQVNAKAHPDMRMSFDPAQNMQQQFQISKGGTDFTPWSVYKSGAYQRFMPQGGTQPINAAGMSPPDTSPQARAQGARELGLAGDVVPFPGSQRPGEQDQLEQWRNDGLWSGRGSPVGPIVPVRPGGPMRPMPAPANEARLSGGVQQAQYSPQGDPVQQLEQQYTRALQSADADYQRKRQMVRTPREMADLAQQLKDKRANLLQLYNTTKQQVMAEEAAKRHDVFQRQTQEHSDAAKKESERFSQEQQNRRQEAQGWKLGTDSATGQQIEYNPQLAKARTKDGKPYTLEGDFDPQTATTGRSKQQITRLMIGSNEVAKAVNAMAALPGGTTLGVFGGAQAMLGEDLGTNMKKTLANAATPEASQVLKTLSNGVARGLAILSSGGAATGMVTLSKQLASDIPAAEDTGLAVAAKFADIRQIVEAANEVLLTDPDINKNEKARDLLANINGQVQKVVPFTTVDVARLVNGDEARFTEFAQKLGLGPKPDAEAPIPGEVIQNGWRYDARTHQPIGPVQQ